MIQLFHVSVTEGPPHLFNIILRMTSVQSRNRKTGKHSLPAMYFTQKGPPCFNLIERTLSSAFDLEYHFERQEHSIQLSTKRRNMQRLRKVKQL